ncbi:MAG: hypothetical protein ACOH2E_04680 [Candidatus Paracaedibacter sp.]
MDDWSIAILKAEFPSIRRRAIPIANNLEVKTQNEKKEDVSKTVRDAPVEPYQNLAEAGIIPQKMSSKEIIGNLLIEEKREETKSQNLNIAKENFSLENVATAAETKVILKEEKETAAKEGSNSSEVGYKEVKFPSLALIKAKLDLGNSSIFSETDCFHVQSILGGFIGFNFPVLDLKMKCVGISSDYKDKGFYTIYGILDVMFEDNKKTRILLKSSYRKEREYLIQGGVKTEKGNFYMVSDPADLKITVPIKK